MEGGLPTSQLQNGVLNADGLANYESYPRKAFSRLMIAAVEHV